MPSYAEFIGEEIDSFKSYGLFYDMAIRYIPSFFKLLCKILEMDDITFETRVRINCALAYLVIENDAIPENIYGAEGYMDDLYILVYVLKEIFPKHQDIMKAQWNSIMSDEKNVPDLESTISNCEAISMKVLKERRIIDKTLELAGLKKS